MESTVSIGNIPKKTNKVAERNDRIANLRILCIILVVFAHSIIIYKNNWNYYSTDWQSNFLNYLCQFIYLFHMPLFFSLSGYLVRYSYKKNPGIKKFMFKKIERLIIPFLCVGLLYLIPIRYMAQYPEYIHNSVAYNVFINFLLGKDNGHLWFLPALFLIFLLHYLAANYIKNEKIVFSISIVLFACSPLFPSILGNVVSNFIWFHLGYMLCSSSKLYERKMVRYYSLILFIVAVISYFLVPEMAILKKGIQFVAAFTGIIFLHVVIPNKKSSRSLSLIEKNSFDIYLLHSPLLYLVFCFFPNIPPLVMVFVNFCVLGLFAFGVAFFLRKTKLKFILGEK